MSMIGKAHGLWGHQAQTGHSMQGGQCCGGQHRGSGGIRASNQRVVFPPQHQMGWLSLSPPFLQHTNLHLPAVRYTPSLIQLCVPVAITVTTQPLPCSWTTLPPPAADLPAQILGPILILKPGEGLRLRCSGPHLWSLRLFIC